MKSKLIDKLKRYGAIGLIALSSCASIEKTPVNEQIGKYLFGHLTTQGVILGYDTDNDNIEDTRLFYQLFNISSEGTLHFQLYGISEDKNRNSIFEENEFRFIEEKEHDVKNSGNIFQKYVTLNN